MSNTKGQSWAAKYVSCAVCNNKISSLKISCPHCGDTDPKYIKPVTQGSIISAIIVSNLIMAALAAVLWLALTQML